MATFLYTARTKKGEKMERHDRCRRPSEPRFWPLSAWTCAGVRRGEERGACGQDRRRRAAFHAAIGRRANEHAVMC